jgi:hypothetical protein
MTHGVGEFDDSNESWSEFQKRLELMFEAQDVTAPGKKRAILLSTCGRRTFQVARSLCAPDKVASKSYAQICELLDGHFNPRPSEIVQRFHFHNRVQRAGESVSEFLAELRKLSEHCNFGTSLEDLLRDRLVCGIADSQTRNLLLREPTLTLKSAKDIALAAESAARNCRLLSDFGTESKSDDSVKQLQQKQSRRCWRCLSSRHSCDACPHSDSRCFACDKVGHLAKACKTGRRQQRANRLSEEEAEETSADCGAAGVYSLYRVQATQDPASRQLPPVRTSVMVNGRPFKMEVDTGASVSIVSERTYWQTLRDSPLKSTKARLTEYTGKLVPLLGELSV